MKTAMNQLGVRAKLLLSVGILATGYFMFFGLAQWTAAATERHLLAVTQSIYPAAQGIEHARAGYKKVMSDYESSVLLQDPSGLQTAAADERLVTADTKQALDLVATQPELQQQVAELANRVKVEQAKAKEIYTKVLGGTGAISDALQLEISVMSKENAEMDQQFALLGDAIGNKALKNELRAVNESNQRLRMLALLLFLLAATIAAVTLFVMERQVSKPLRDVAQRLADGANQVSSSAQQVWSSGASIAEGASLQAGSLEETSASSEEISSMAKRNAVDCRSTAELVDGSQQKVKLANDSLQHLVVAMNEIRASSGKVSKIIKVIDEIAFKTNILALNASVEAARAGQAGMGFAVVAEEVRNLAQKCAQAARDSAEIVDESIVRSNDGKVKLDDVAAAIHAVTEDSAKIKELVDHMQVASVEQTSGITQIANSIFQMEKVTQASAGTAQESSAAAEELKAQSNLLQEIVRNLSEIVAGSGDAPTSGLRGRRAA